jgi:hypothetical protein
MTDKLVDTGSSVQKHSYVSRKTYDVIVFETSVFMLGLATTCTAVFILYCVT